MKYEPIVSFVLPAYNEGKQIEGFLEKLNHAAKRKGRNYEIVVVDDGSLDDTRDKALKYAVKNGRIRVIGYEKNVGKGFAVQKGFSHSRGDVVVIMDSDLDIDAEQVTKYVDALRYGDIAVGSKWHQESFVDIPVIRKFLSRGFNVLARLLAGIKTKDTQTGIKAIRRKAFEDVFRRLRVNRFAFDVELLVAAQMFDLKIVELPVKMNVRTYFKLIEIWRMFVDLIWIAYRVRVKKWYRRSARYYCTCQL